jgi:hypothetical protein
VLTRNFICLSTPFGLIRRNFEKHKPLASIYLENEMARKHVSATSWPQLFLDFVQANPQLAAALAFQLGNMAGHAVANSDVTSSALAKKAKKVPRQIANAMPESVSALALKFLPGPSPKLQPRKRPASKMRVARKPKVAS